MSCDCSTSEIRGMQTSVGIQYRHQCLTCGRAIGNAISHAKVTTYVPWDNDLAERWSAMHRERRLQTVREREEQTAQWWARYHEHLASEEWQATRAKVLRRDGYRCQGCLGREATDVHHTTYKRLGRELLIDLVALCRPCHDLVHEE